MHWKGKGKKIVVTVEDSHSLIQLPRPYLEKTGKEFWKLGRKPYLRVHLAVMILQGPFKWIDRETEAAIKVCLSI